MWVNRPALPPTGGTSSLSANTQPVFQTVSHPLSEGCREHLRVGRSFAFNATNITHPTRARWISLFADYQARIEIVYVEPPLSVILAQNRERKNPVPETVIRRLAEKVDPPSITEAHGLIIDPGVA